MHSPSLSSLEVCAGCKTADEAGRGLHRIVEECKTLQMVSLLTSCCHAASAISQLCHCMQIKRAIDPEAEAMRMAEMRRLQRQMKGIKLQYMATDDTVFFDDVAGIGEAKVFHIPMSVALCRRVFNAL